jgi:hypothetical protein
MCVYVYVPVYVCVCVCVLGDGEAREVAFISCILAPFLGSHFVGISDLLNFILSLSALSWFLAIMFNGYC